MKITMREMEIESIVQRLTIELAVPPMRVWSPDFRDIISDGKLGPIIDGEPGPEYLIYKTVAECFIETYMEPGRDVKIVKPHRIVDITGRVVYSRIDIKEDE